MKAPEITKSYEIVVGVDGSPSGHTAALWAAAEASRRSVGLVVLCSYEWRVVGSRAAVGGEYAAYVEAHAKAVVADIVADVAVEFPHLAVRGEVVLGQPAAALIEASRQAELVVVGNRGRGGFASLLLGSISQQVATHAHGPVAVVRGRTGILTGPVVVGADGSAGGRDAIGVAFMAADARGVGLLAVRTYRPARPAWGPEVVPFVEDDGERETYECAVLEDDLRPWLEKYPEVTVKRAVVPGDTADVLLGLADTAQLLVVGSRGHGGFAGLLLGSVSQQVLHHAACPVVVARDGTVHQA